MIAAYHRRLVERANAAVATGQITSVFQAMIADAAVWAIPLFVILGIQWVFDLRGTAQLIVELPLVAISLFGSCFYVGWVYCRALSRVR